MATSAERSPWNSANADAMTVDSWGGGTQMSAFPPLVPAKGNSGLYQCPTHPEFRTNDPSAFCPLCEAAWEEQRRELRTKRQSVEEQLQNLQSVDSAAAILQDLQVSMKDWKPQPEADTSATATPRSTDIYGRTLAAGGVNSANSSSGNNSNNPHNHQINRPFQSFPANGRQPKEQPPPPPPPMPAASPGNMPPSFFSPFYDQSGGNGMGQMQAFAMQLQSVQRMQDWMLYQKEQECQQLRQALEERRSEVQQLQVDKALLQEKLYQQEERMKHELKLIKLAALQQQQQRKKGGSGNKSGSGGEPFASTPVVLLPDHMLTHSKEEVANATEPPPPSVSSSQATPKTATQSAFNTPSSQAAAATHASLSLASYRSNEASPHQVPSFPTPPPTAGQTEEAPGLSQFSSQEESVKSGSEASSLKRRTKAPGSWILNSKSAPDASRKSTNSVPVDTDDFVDLDDSREEAHAQVSPEQAPPAVVPRIKDGYGTDDSDDEDDHVPDVDDTSFRQMVSNANSAKLPDGTDLFSVDGSAAPQGKAPIKVLGVSPAVPKENGGAKTKEAPISPSRGVSFPDTADVDDNMSLGNTVASSTFGEDRQKVTDQVILDPYGDRGTFTGIILRSTGMPHGPGRMIYNEDRRTYDGEWRHGRWHGYGRATFANGDTYDGEYRFDQRHGRGRYQWSDGRVYDGMFREDRRHGRGKFTWPDGAVYEGEFRSGQREGQGTYQFSDGGRYEGSWKDGRYNGYGVCKWEDGRCYKGEWLNGMAHGKGVETFADGTVRHDGQWIEDEPV